MKIKIHKIHCLNFMYFYACIIMKWVLMIQRIEINIHTTNGLHARAIATLIAKLSGILLTMNLFMKHNHY
ncbi:hypothetical protein CN417_30420 [Bacillus thuringiensis]|nr:hypothetical protein CN417_30420 [Bacillus thuringiensis]PEW37229.1 hypothetical protein CN444_29590 [Bacillus thuringiensis]PFK09221.1 hypothetical protein COJ17_22605 [Bacillus thuringiensis]